MTQPGFNLHLGAYGGANTIYICHHLRPILNASGNLKNKQYNTIRTIPKFNRKITETEEDSIPLTHPRIYAIPIYHAKLVINIDAKSG